tara:strand:+ start:469 stop:654 length:186 start_codon:yes stop_codon:yes gene_type:complete
MLKEFKINDILSAVDTISKIDKKKTKNLEKKYFTSKNDILEPINQAKLKSSEILVLDEMIE